MENIDAYAFAYCTSLESIKFCGTRMQWNILSRAKPWCQYAADYRITCDYNDKQNSES